MQVLFIHPNFPGQFALVAHYLTTHLNWPCVFVTSVDTTHLQLSFTHINYRLHEDAPQPKVFHNPDSLQGLLDHLAAIYRGLRGLSDLKPDLVVGHMSYGTMLYLRNLYGCPFVGYYEILPPPFWGEGMVLRKEFPPPETVRLFNATYHALTHLHLAACDAGYTSTQYQLSTCPPEWRHKLKVIFDGVDCTVFQPRVRPTSFRDLTVGPETKVVTFASRGLESVRGFDVFMRVAKRILERRHDVLFVVSGGERTYFGHELYHLGQQQSFKQWVLAQDSYDLSRFVFLEPLQLQEQAALFNLSDLHVSLSVNYLMPESLVPAMASGCPVLASATPPIQEAIEGGVHGRLAGFDDVEALTERAMQMLDRPEESRALGQAARERVLERYELGLCLRQVAEFYQSFARPMSPADLALATL